MYVVGAVFDMCDLLVCIIMFISVLCRFYMYSRLCYVYLCSVFGEVNKFISVLIWLLYDMLLFLIFNDFVRRIISKSNERSFAKFSGLVERRVG